MALYHLPNVLKPILVGDLNFNLSQTEDRESDKDLAVILVVEEME